MNFPLLIRQRLKDLGTEQRDLAAATQVTDSYISQLLTGKKTPPAPDRTDIYDKMDSFLKLPAGTLGTMADLQRTEALKRRLADPPAPLFKEVRELILRKCEPGRAQAMRAMFEKEPFGALERLVTQKLLDVVKRVTKEELDDEKWLRRVARLTRPKLRAGARHRARVPGGGHFQPLGRKLRHLSRSADRIVGHRPGDVRDGGHFEPPPRARAPEAIRVRRTETTPPLDGQPGFQAFLQDPALSGDATADEIEFLKKLQFRRKQPTPLYYYRELQNLRDPLHFRRA